MYIKNKRYKLDIKVKLCDCPTFAVIQLQQTHIEQFKQNIHASLKIMNYTKKVAESMRKKVTYTCNTLSEQFSF